MIYSFCHIGALSRYERSDLMSAKRRDNRKRILRNGESQRKDGRYQTRISLGGGKKPICLYGHTLKEVKKKRENY